MSHARVTRALVAAASATALLALAACSTAATPSASGPASGGTDEKCAAYKAYGALRTFGGGHGVSPPAARSMRSR